MLCYKDKTFCKFFKTCKNENMCKRKATDDIFEKTKKVGFPVCYFLDKPKCFKFKNRGKQ